MTNTACTRSTCSLCGDTGRFGTSSLMSEGTCPMRCAAAERNAAREDAATRARRNATTGQCSLF